MEILQIIGTFFAGIVAILIFIANYRRPLFYSISKKYNRSSINKNKEIVIIDLHNDGIHSEYEIIIEISANINYSLLSFKEKVQKMDNNVIFVKNLTRGEHLEILLLVENQYFSKDSIISIYSRDGKFKYKEINDISFKNFSLGRQLSALLFAMFLPISIFATGYIFGMGGLLNNIVFGLFYSDNELHLIECLKDEGWYDIGDFINSPFRKSYPASLIPIKLISANKISDEKVRFIFEIENKTEYIWEVSASIEASFISNKKANFSEKHLSNMPINSNNKNVIILYEVSPDSNNKFEYYAHFTIHMKDNIRTPIGIKSYFTLNMFINHER